MSEKQSGKESTRVVDDNSSKKSKDEKMEEEEETRRFSPRRNKSQDNKKNKKLRSRPSDNEEYDTDEDSTTDKASSKNSMGAGYAGDMCHEMEISDACTACFCPCITYGQILEKLDPNVISKHSKKGSNCHVSTGCLLWSGLMGLSLGGIQSLISIPGAFNWMPTLYFADLIDARELFLTCSYFVPQWLCHLPLRASIVGGGKGGENPCCSCLIASLCCSCSLGSLKTWARGGKFKYKDEDVCVSKCCPCCGAFQKANSTEENYEEGEGGEYENDDDDPPKQRSNFSLVYNPNIISMMENPPRTTSFFHVLQPQNSSIDSTIRYHPLPFY